MEMYDEITAVNLRGVLHGMKHGIRAIMQSGNGGAVINWSSAGGMNSSAGSGVYGATKAGVISLTKTGVDRVRTQGHPGQLHLPRVHPQ